MVDVTEPTVEQVALEQRAVNPRTDEPIVDAPIVEELDLNAVEAPEEDQQPEVPVKVKKTAEDVLKGRVGHLTKTLSAKDVELETIRSQLATALALNNSASENIQSNTSQIVQTPADFEAAVTARVEAQEFNRNADEMYNSGAAKFSDWKDSVDMLVTSGFMDKNLLDAAMAVEDGAIVLHYLGTNLDEAERINVLPPIRKAAEMAKLSVQLSTPRSVTVSSAPTPIRPVTGSPSPVIDLQRVAETDNMKEYAAARAKQGSRWAQGRG